jgi:predicted amidohydrolase
VSELADIARSAGVWLVPGSVCEIDADGKYYNTAIVLSPEGELVSHYRKIFPWRPYERHEPGREFEVFEIPGVGRLGLSICYDAWFPEVTRHLAWMGAEIVLNVVKTTTPDRVQELVLAQANSIVNQTFTVSVNTAGPEGEGFSLIVDPEGVVLESAPSREEALLTHTIDLDHVSRTREFGTAGFNRLWSQFLPTDAALDLPLYGGRIEPMKWAPAGRSANARIVPTAEGVGGQKRATREV